MAGVSQPPPHPPVRVAPNPFVIVLPASRFAIGERFQIAVRNTSVDTVVRELHDCQRNWEIVAQGGRRALYHDFATYCTRQADTRPVSFAPGETRMLSDAVALERAGRYEVRALGARATIVVGR
jgi:hypothetical protein